MWLGEKCLFQRFAVFGAQPCQRTSPKDLHGHAPLPRLQTPLCQCWYEDKSDHYCQLLTT